jgi:hypothetical protein
VSSRFHSTVAWLGAITGLLLLVFVTHIHWMGFLSSHFIGGSQGDGGLYVWLTASFHHFPNLALRGESHVFYPYPLTRAWSDSFLLPSALASVLLSCGVSLAAAYNTVYIAALVFNGLGVLALCRALAVEWMPSFFAAAAFACSSYLTGNFGHPQLQFFFWVPLAWACVIGSRNSSMLRWFVAGLCVAASFYCAVYYAIFAALGLGVIWLFSLQLDWRSFKEAGLRASAMGLGALPIAWLLPSYLQVKDTFGSRGLYEADAFAASGLSYLSFPAFNWLFGFTSQWTHTEATLCAGFLVLCAALAHVARERQKLSLLSFSILLLASLTLVCASSVVDVGIASELLTALSGWVVLLVVCTYAVRTRSPRALFAALIALFFVLSFGPAGNPTKGEPALAPFTILYSLMPGMDSVRAVSRFGSVVIMGVYITAALALGSLFKGTRLRRTAWCALLLGITMLENYTPVFPLDPLSPRPAAFDSLEQAAQPHDAAIALPFAGELEKGRVKSWSESATLSTRYALWSASSGIPFVNGYSGQRPKLSMELPEALRSFPSAESFDWLSRICGLRWIIVVPSLFKSWDQPLFEQRLQDNKDRFSLVATGADGSMLIRIDPWTTTSSPIFTPPSSPLLLEFQAPSASGCAASVYELGRDEGNNVTSRQVQKVSLEAAGASLQLPKQTSSTGNARLLSVQITPCSAAFRCAPADLGGLK